MNQTALLLHQAIHLYVFAGLLVALAFLLVGLGRVHPEARGFNPLFRLFIAPGVVLLWPLVLALWLRHARALR